VVVTDASKLGAVSDFAVGPLESADILVTDGDVSEPERPALEEAGVEVVVVPGITER
jgi:DeoR/GlpR family transcriptional regulator of sugar metabolism